jgi:hypothetical protein
MQGIRDLGANHRLVVGKGEQAAFPPPGGHVVADPLRLRLLAALVEPFERDQEAGHAANGGDGGHGDGGDGGHGTRSTRRHGEAGCLCWACPRQPRRFIEDFANKFCSAPPRLSPATFSIFLVREITLARLPERHQRRRNRTSPHEAMKMFRNVVSTPARDPRRNLDKNGLRASAAPC